MTKLKTLANRPENQPAFKARLSEAKELLEQGKTRIEVSDLTGLSKSTLHTHFKGMNSDRVRPKKAKVIGPWNRPIAMRKKNAKDMPEVKAMFEDGVPYTEVARTFHISQKVLRREFPGYSWTNEQSGSLATAIRNYGKALR